MLSIDPQLALAIYHPSAIFLGLQGFSLPPLVAAYQWLLRQPFWRIEAIPDVCHAK
jgi:hypothetical protein